jgi:AbrB family looped-hinge helix DNA binding protein
MTESAPPTACLHDDLGTRASSAALILLGCLTGLSKKDAAMRITSEGRVTIPQEIREIAGLTPGTDVEFEVEDGVVRLVKARRRAGRKTRGQRLVDSLRGHGDFKMTTDEVIALMRGPAADEA